MELEKLFQTQKVLMDRIEQKHPIQMGENRFLKRLLALLVEAGELANEWRGFKFWSTNQEPRVIEKCRICDGNGLFDYGDKQELCGYCNATGIESWPLLEEYVDGLHFVLELAIVLEVKINFEDIRIYKSNSIEHQFIKLYREITNIWIEREFFLEVLNTYIGLGELLGFTWEEIKQAYFDKNAVNHQRQEDGY